MAAADRQVRRLHLQAPSTDAVRALLPRLEDGLRCASLPGQDSRLYLVRHLDLGRISHDVTPQTLALLIERRLSAQAGRWLEGGTPAAEQAGCVAFASALDARIRLALTLVRSMPARAWYWPMAAPEFDPGLGPADNLARIATALAQWPEARVALPAWLAAVESETAGAGWLASVDPEQGRAWLRWAGIDVPGAPAAQADGPTVGKPDTERDPPALWWQPARRRADRISAAPDVRATPNSAATTAARNRTPASAPPQVAAIGTPPPSHAAPTSQAAPRRPAKQTRKPGPDAAWDRGWEEDRTPQAPDGPTTVATAGTEGPSGAAAAPIRTDPHLPSPQADPYLPPTAAGGLLFLLPVLARLGLPQWLAEDDDAAGDFARHVLQLALGRLTVAEGDPAWLLAGPMPSALPPNKAPAPLSWHDPLLAARGRQTVLAEALNLAGNVDAQAALWLTAARRWLRRAGRIGLASLVLRPARLGVTATHLDLHFRLQDADLRVRRLGLDIDPGWLPWFGRVVAFHYLEVLP